MILAKDIIKYFETTLSEFEALDLSKTNHTQLVFFLLELSKIAAGTIRINIYQLDAEFVFDHVAQLSDESKSFLKLVEDKYVRWMDDLVDEYNPTEATRITSDMIELMIRVWLCKKIISSLQPLSFANHEPALIPITNVILSNLLEAKKVLDKRHDSFSAEIAKNTEKANFQTIISNEMIKRHFLFNSADTEVFADLKNRTLLSNTHR